MTLIDALTQNADGTVPSYAWPGGYPIFYLTSDGDTFCPACVNKEVRLILDDTLEDSRSGWAVIAGDINWEDADMVCCNCNKRIESAYAEDSTEA